MKKLNENFDIQYALYIDAVLLSDQLCRVMMDYVKMEAEYNCSKEVDSTGIRI